MSDVTMLTSLKALLSSSAATQMPADGAGAIAMPGDGAVDFAQLLNGSMATSPPAQAATGAGEAVAAVPTVALPDATDLAGKEAPVADAVAANALPFGLATVLNAVQSQRKASLPLPAGLAQRVEKLESAGTGDAPAATVSPADAEVAEPVKGGAVDPAVDPAVVPMPDLAEAEPVAIDAPVVKQGVSAKVARPADPARVAKAGLPSDAPSVEQSADEVSDDQQDDRPAGALAQSTPLPLTVPAPMPGAPQQTAPTGPTLTDAAPRIVDAASAPLSSPADVSAMAAQLAAAAPQLPEQARSGDGAKAKVPTGNIAAASAAEQSVVADDAPAPAPVVQAQPVKAEALALLQMVRDQVAGRQSGASSRGTESLPVSGRGKAERSAKAVEAVVATPAQSLSADATPQVLAPQSSAGTTASQAVVAAAPVTDLSASLGAQVVDMGVSGQWIDGLARDIAGLSANGAQGRFQINADKLGPVQVDIRQGQDGAAVSLTVASEAAETALRQDSDRLRLDAGLAAVRITDVKIERAPHVAETARADSASQQGSQQQSSQQQSGQNPWSNNQTMGQNMSQSQGQNRWQARENSGFTPKNSGDPAVLNHDDTRRAANDAAHARYA